MPLTRDFKQTVQARIARDPAYRKELLRQGLDCLHSGDVDTGKAILRDYINATIGFEKLSDATGTPTKSLMRMLSPKGNPQARNLFEVIAHLQRSEGLRSMFGSSGNVEGTLGQGGVQSSITSHSALSATAEIPAIPAVPAGLREAAQRGTLVPFVGAGASRLGGCPGWSEFADGALQRFVDQGKFTYSQLEQIRYLSPRLKLSLARALEDEHKIAIDFRQLLHPRDRSEELKGRRLYGSLSKLGKTFVTTNYDEWLDEELAEPVLSLSAGEAVATAAIPTKRTVIHRTVDLIPAALNEPNTVIHLHGSVLDPNGLILTTRDYVRHYANDRFAGEPAQENRVLTFLEHLFTHKTVLFVGYGLEELEILEYIILKRRSAAGERPEARHYLLQGFFSHEEQVLRTLRTYYLNECGIELIPFLRDQKDREQLLDVLEEFARQVPASAPMVLQRAQEMEALLDG